MRWLYTMFKSRTVLAVLGFLLAAALIIFGGAYLGWGWTIRIIALLGVLVLILVGVVIRVVRANRSADQIERSIKQQAEEQILSTRPDKQAEMQEVQRQLEQAIERLKQSKLGRGQRGRAALYALPWYMFIGPPGAGKTTAIVNSGLNFPIGTDSVRGVGGTRNCDWFFTDQAILIDTAGRYMTEAEDTEEWLTFLEMLKQHRSERPINGVIVGMPVDELAGARMDEIEWHADNIRRRIDELVQHLGVHFPIYLVFTKSDLLQGFVEFFGEYSRREREQIWGATFDAEQQQADVRSVFEKEFDRLVSMLQNRRTARLSRPMKREERRKVYAFPLQFSTVKENLGLFIQRLFQANPYQESPTFRGFYFTSGTQEGVPLDRVIQAIAKQFDLAPVSEGGDFDDFGAGVETEAKSYFLTNLFTDVIVPDQYMVRRTTKERRAGSMQRMVIMATAAVLLVLFLVGASQALVRGKISLNQARETATSVSAVHWDDPSAAAENLERMEDLRQELDRLDKIQWLSLGLSRNGSVREPARRLYLDRARSFVRYYPLQALEQGMQQATRTLRIEGAGREQLYQDLKAYLLLTEEVRRLDDEDEGHRNFLVRALTDLATDRLGEEVSGPRAELRERVEPQVTAFVDALQRDTLLAYAEDQRLIRTARERIYEPPSISGVYQRMKLDGRDNLPPVTLADLVPGRYLNLLQTDDEVSGFFTQQGWKTYVQETIAEESQDPAGEDWVLGREGGDLPEEMRNREQMADQLRQMYFNDYASEWDRFLGNVQVRPFGDLRETSRAMETLSDPFESPLAHLLARATDQTSFRNELLEDVQGQAAEAAGRAVDRAVRRRVPGARAPDLTQGDEQELPPVDRRFRWLHSLNAPQAQSNQASAEYYEVFDVLREVSATLDEVSGDDAKAATFAADVLGRNGGDLDDAVSDIRNALRLFDQDVRNHLFIEPIVGAWRTVLGAAQQYLSERWRSVVYEPFRSTMGGSYPFDRTSQQDAPIMDVAGFFDPAGGPVTQFLDEELAPYIERDLSRPKTWEGYGIAISPAARQAIGRAQNIAENLFSGGAMRASFELQPEQPDRSEAAPVPDQVSLQLLGEPMNYRLGFQPTVSYEWPGPSGAAVIISTQAGDLPAKRYEGDWALFRLLQDARVQRTSTTEYEIRVPVSDAQQRYTITAIFNLRTRSANNPFNDPSNFFNFNPPEKLD